MNIELGKSYIVDVIEKGIIPLMEFDRSHWYNKDYDDLDFLTDEEKEVIVNNLLEQLRAEIEQKIKKRPGLNHTRAERERNDAFLEVLDILEKYREGQEDVNPLIPINFLICNDITDIIDES